MIGRLAIGAAFAAVLLLLVAVVALPVFLHPVSEDQARALAVRQPGLATYRVSDSQLVVTFDGRVRDNGFVVYTMPGPKVDIAGAAAAPPAAFWLVHLQSPQRRCGSALVVIDAGNGDVALVSRALRPCTQF